MRCTFLVGSLCVLSACGGSDTGSGLGEPTADAPPLVGDMFTMTWGPVNVPPGEENTKCMWIRLANDTPLKVHQLHNLLSASSHHLIVYRDNHDTTEQATPIDCQPFTGALNQSGMIAPMVITQKQDDELTLPDQVAYTLAPHQMIKLEMHYINSTDTAAMATATVNFFKADEATIKYEADILFMGSLDIGTCNGCTPIPAGQSATLHQFLTIPSYLDLSQSHIYAITGHTHKLGTDMQVRVAPSAMGPMTPVYKPNPFVWSEPLTAVHRPAFSVPVDGGLDFECSWTNTTNAEVKLGESANAEMCFFWAYYYPSQGSKFCAHTQRYGGVNGLNICCPDDSLCSMINF